MLLKLKLLAASEVLQQVNQMRAEFEQAKQTIVTLQQSNDMLVAEVAKLSKDNEVLTKAVTQLEHEKQLLEIKLDYAERYITSLESRVTMLGSDKEYKRKLALEKNNMSKLLILLTLAMTFTLTGCLDAQIVKVPYPVYVPEVMKFNLQTSM